MPDSSSASNIEVDINQIATDLNGKADVDLSNISPSSTFKNILNTAGIRTVVETYINGTDWYRVWSDGWCEQGGIWTSPSAAYNSYTITFLKPYKDTNYIAMAIIGYTGADCWGAQINTKSTTQVNFVKVYNSNGNACWFTAGYIS